MAAVPWGGERRGGHDLMISPRGWGIQGAPAARGVPHPRRLTAAEGVTAAARIAGSSPCRSKNGSARLGDGRNAIGVPDRSAQLKRGAWRCAMDRSAFALVLIRTPGLDSSAPSLRGWN